MMREIWLIVLIKGEMVDMLINDELYIRKIYYTVQITKVNLSKLSQA